MSILKIKNLRTVVLLLATYHLLVFTLPYVGSYLHELSVQTSEGSVQMGGDEQKKDFLFDLRELEDLEETDTDGLRFPALPVFYSEPCNFTFHSTFSNSGYHASYFADLSFISTPRFIQLRTLLI